MKRRCIQAFNLLLLINITCTYTAAFIPRELITLAQNYLVHNNHVKGVLFTHDDPVKKILLGLIYNEKKSIKAVQYRITDPHIAQALIDAQKRGVCFHCVIDQGCIQEHSEKVTLLHYNGAKVRIFPSRSFSLMHNKFFIFEDNFLHKKIVWTGSANITQSGLTRNQENIVIVDDKDTVLKFIEKFNDLYQKSILLREYRPRIDISLQTKYFKQTLKDLCQIA